MTFFAIRTTDLLRRFCLWLLAGREPYALVVENNRLREELTKATDYTVLIEELKLVAQEHYDKGYNDGLGDGLLRLTQNSTRPLMDRMTRLLP